MATYKKDIDNFEFNKSYNLPSEHKWCYLYTQEGVKDYEDKKEEAAKSRFKRGRVQSNPETTGQYGTML